jgi:hypothetical protein
MADDEQPLPTNVMYPGTSNFWRNDDFDIDDGPEAGTAALEDGAAAVGGGGKEE